MPDTGDDKIIRWNVNAEHAVDLEPYLHVKTKLSISEWLIFREQRKLLPPALQGKVVYLGESLGHLRKTKRKMLVPANEQYDLFGY